MTNSKNASAFLRPTICTIAAATMLVGTTAWAVAPDCPFQSRFGKKDEIGASQTQNPAKVLEAIELIDTGRVYALAHDMDERTIPLPFGRVFDVEMFQFPFPPPDGQLFSQGTIAAHIGQLGTQFDALGHAGHPDFGFFNCLPASDVEPDEDGLIQKLGVETVKPFFTRAVLLDFVNHFSKTIDRKKKMAGKILPPSYIITLEDVMEVLESEDVGAPGEGDVALFYTGSDRFFGVGEEGDTMLGDTPGIGVEVADWLAGQKVAMVGADNLAVEAQLGFGGADDFPPGHPLEAIAGGFANPVHLVLLTQHGIHLLELMKLEELAEAMLEKQTYVHDEDDDNPYDFAFIYATVPIKGMAGSPGQPLAVD